MRWGERRAVHLMEKREDALNGQSCALKIIIMIIMVSNDLISVLFAVFLQHISPATEVVFLIMSSSCATPPLFKVFRCRYFSRSFGFSFESLYSLKLLVHPGLHPYCFTFDWRRNVTPDCGLFHPFNDALRSGPPARLPTGLSFTLLCTGIYM